MEFKPIINRYILFRKIAGIVCGSLSVSDLTSDFSEVMIMDEILFFSKCNVISVYDKHFHMNIYTWSLFRKHSSNQQYLQRRVFCMKTIWNRVSVK